MNQFTRSNSSNRFQWSSFIIGILSLLLGFFVFNHPAMSIVTLVIFLAVGAILKGIFELFFRRRLRQFSGYSSTLLIIIGIVDIFIGIFLYLNIGAGIIALPYILAIWLLFDSIGTIITASPIRQFNTAQFWFTIVVGVIGIVLSFLIFYNPLSAYITIALLIGIYFVINGILQIVYAF